MQYRILGKTGLKVSEIGFGGWAIGGGRGGSSGYGPTDDGVSVATIKRALDYGCNFFDTADTYGHGHSEELLGETLKAVRKKVIIGTKVGYNFPTGTRSQNFLPAYIRNAMDESLKRLQTDYIDIYQLHNPPFEVIKKGEALETIKELKRLGKTRFIGVSIHEPQDAMEAIKQGVDSVQLVYNLVERKHEDTLQFALQSDIGIIAREPLARGVLTGKFSRDATFVENDARSLYSKEKLAEYLEKASAIKQRTGGGTKEMVKSSISFVLANKAVSVTIVGVKTPEQVEENFNL